MWVTWFIRPLLFVLLTADCLLPSAFAGELPSLFRGVVVADSSMGVRVVTVEADSQAALADLRPDDLIVRVHGRDIRSIDGFATLSHQLKGQTAVASLVVFRQGMPRELLVHLYSYPVLREWGIQFIPEHDIRFAQPEVGFAYWQRLGRGFEEVKKPDDALAAYLNALHHAPMDTATAIKVSTLFSRLSQRHVREGRLEEGVAALRHSVQMMDHLLKQPLADEQLQSLQQQLQETVTALRDFREHQQVQRAKGSRQ